MLCFFVAGSVFSWFLNELGLLFSSVEACPGDEQLDCKWYGDWACDSDDAGERGDMDRVDSSLMLLVIISWVFWIGDIGVIDVLCDDSSDDDDVLSFDEGDDEDDVSVFMSLHTNSSF